MRGATGCSFINRLNAIVEHAFMTCESWDPLVTSMNVRMHSEHPQRGMKLVATETTTATHKTESHNWLARKLTVANDFLRCTGADCADFLTFFGG